MVADRPGLDSHNEIEGAFHRAAKILVLNVPATVAAGAAEVREGKIGLLEPDRELVTDRRLVEQEPVYFAQRFGHEILRLWD
jgi:hypothetical protein